MAAILVVDDQSSARTTLALLLRHRGHLVREADSVTAAVRELHAEAFDVIVTDLRMPDGVGLDVLHTAKVHCPDANVILLTAYPAWESAKEAMRLGAFDYFEKGQEPDGLFRRIDRALEEQRAGMAGGETAVLEHLPHRCPCPMQPHPLVGRRDAKQPAHLGRVKPGDVTQEDDLALFGRERIDRRPHELHRLVPEDL